MPHRMTSAEALANPAIAAAMRRGEGKVVLDGAPDRSARAQQRRQPGTMNKTEAAYAAHLEAAKKMGQVLDFRFEAVKLRLADKTFYTPDFMVLTTDRLIEFHEVKGFWEDDARVKIKVAAEQHWWARFRAVKKLAAKRGGGWETEEF